MSKITEIIEKMKKIYEKYGDIDVVYWNPDWGEYYNIDDNDVDDMVVVVEGEDMVLSMNGVAQWK